MLPLWRAVFPSLASTLSVAPFAYSSALRTIASSSQQLISGYNIFQREEYKKAEEELKKARGTDEKISIGEVSQILAARWKKLTDATKDKYNVKAQKETRAESKLLKSAIKEQAKDVKRPLSGFNLFVIEESKDELKGDLKAIAAKWKSLSDEKKEEYNEKAKLTVRPDKKAGSKVSGYTMFIKEFAETLKKDGKTGVNVITAAAANWKAMSDVQKDAYNAKAAAAKKDE